MNLPVAILAGGMATRMRPLTEKIPKALIQVQDQPFLAHQLHLLHRQGIQKVVICTWYRSEMIREFAGTGSAFGLEIEYISDGEQPLGTGGALRKALPLLGDNFFVLYGDSYLPCDYHAVANAFFASQKDALMTVYHNHNQGDRSNVQFENGQIVVYDKKQQTAAMEYLDYGLGVFRSARFLAYPESRPFDLAEVYQNLLAEGRLAGYEVRERFYEIGSFDGLLALEHYLTGEKRYG